MKIGIIQLSDIHFKGGKNLVIDYKQAFQKACLTYVKDCMKIIVVISGDIAFSGKKGEYDIAYTFFKDAEQVIRKEAIWINSFDYVIVPGNHDCDFSTGNEVRNIVISSVCTEDELKEDELIKCCLCPQKEFWKFYSRLVENKKDPKISYKESFPLTVNPNFDIELHCYNTSLLSQLKETQGTLIVPTNCYLNTETNHRNLVISIFHHNPSWLSANTPKNNKKNFEAHLLKESDIVMCGHEHSPQHIEVSNINSSSQITYLESPAFQEDGKSEFNILKFNTENNKLTNIEFRLDIKNSIYSCSDEKEIRTIEKICGIGLRKEFSDSLDSIEIPLKHSAKENLRLSDVYVYPDLESFAALDSKVIQYTDASILSTDKEDGRNIFIEGDSQSGKSSLIRMTFMSFIQKGTFPLLIRGADIKNLNINQLLYRAYKRQYENKEFTYNAYCQLDIEQKVLFIEDLNESNLNRNGVHSMLEELRKLFSKVIITISTSFVNEPFLTGTGNDDVKYYHLKSFGYEKRNQLIEKWIYIGKDRNTVKRAELEQKVKLTFDQISSLLGEQYMPSYPVFILSLLQSLSNSLKSFNLTQTAYGYCYYSLIIAALVKEGVNQNKVEGIIQFLLKLAFSLYEKSKNSFSKENYHNFYLSYIKSYRASYTEDKLLEVLQDSYIIKDSEGDYKFTYKYIFYYLIAANISQLRDETIQKKIIKDLCDNMHKEKEANILIFLVNQNIIPDVIQELIFYSWLPFENFNPITLNTDDKLFTQVKSIAEEIKMDVICNDVNPHEERVKELKHKDSKNREQRKAPIITEAEIDKNKDLRDVSSSIKIVRILGQIIKNQRYTFKRDTLLRLVEESYNVSFRTIAFLSEMIGKSKVEIVDYIKKKNKNITKEDATKIENRVTKVLQSMLYRFCLDNFSNISASVGAPGMSDLFNDVSHNMGTPAAKIVSFTINSYYNKLRIVDLKRIMDEFRNNPVAKEIVRARVINYVYHNYVNWDERQKIGNICNFHLVDKNGYNKYIIEKFSKKHGETDKYKKT
ncbi:hypothetical protein LPYR103PRE_21430 [Segatella asaccharophila]